MKYWLTLVTCLSLIIVGAHVVPLLSFTIDDAFITFSHARNFTRGHGLVFTLGERVEATSSLLWAVLLVPFEALLPDGSILGSKILGVGAIIGTMWCGSKMMSGLVPCSDWRRGLQAVFFLLLSASTSFIAWSVLGLEHGFMAFLLILSVLLFERERANNKGIVSALPTACLEMCRPEGFMFVGIFVLFRVIEAIRTTHRETRKRCMRWFALLTTLVVSYEMFGLLYFGHLMPNSAVVKFPSVSSDRIERGLNYFLQGPAAVYAVALAAVTCLLPLALWRRDGSVSAYRAVSLVLWCALLGQLAFTVVVGGDWMESSRFVSQTYPLLIVLVLLTVWRVLEGRRSLARSVALRRFLTVIGVALTATYLALSFTHASQANIWGAKLNSAEDRAVAGMAFKLNELDPQGLSVVACSDVGRMGYYYRGRTMDWYGLADEEIARKKISLTPEAVSVVLARRPEFIVLYSNQERLSDSTMEFGEALHSRVFFENPELHNNYEQVFALQFWENRYQVLFKRKP